MNEALPQRAQFHHMKEGTQSDWEIIGAEFSEFRSTVVNRIKDHLLLLKGDSGGFPVDRLTHCLQTATLAHQDGKDEEYVVCALLHDIGDTLGPANHADVAAVLREPYVNEANVWMVKHHGIFQGYYFFHYMGLDRNMRDQFADNENFKRTARFIAKYDDPSFDPSMPKMELSLFEPMVRSVFSQPKTSIYKDLMAS